MVGVNPIVKITVKGIVLEVATRLVQTHAQVLPNHRHAHPVVIPAPEHVILHVQEGVLQTVQTHVKDLPLHQMAVMIVLRLALVHVLRIAILPVRTPVTTHVIPLVKGVILGQ